MLPHEHDHLKEQLVNIVAKQLNAIQLEARKRDKPFMMEDCSWFAWNILRSMGRTYEAWNAIRDIAATVVKEAPSIRRPPELEFHDDP